MEDLFPLPFIHAGEQLHPVFSQDVFAENFTRRCICKQDVAIVVDAKYGTWVHFRESRHFPQGCGLAGQLLLRLADLRYIVAIGIDDLSTRWIYKCERKNEVPDACFEAKGCVRIYYLLPAFFIKTRAHFNPVFTGQAWVVEQGPRCFIGQDDRRIKPDLHYRPRVILRQLGKHFIAAFFKFLQNDDRKLQIAKYRLRIRRSKDYKITKLKTLPCMGEMIGRERFFGITISLTLK